MHGTAAKKIADKYITPDGKAPKRETEDDAEPFGPGPDADAAGADVRAARAEREQAAMAKAMAFVEEADKRRRQDAAVLSKVATVMKKSKNQKGGWQTHPDILRAVEIWGSQMKTQRWMAARIGKSMRAFEDAMNKEKGENPLRLAYETGRAEAEQRQIDRCETLDPTDSKQVVGWIFYMKAQHGWRDKPEQANSDAPKINFILPGPMSEADYLKALGIEAPVDTRPVADRTRSLGGVAVGEMKDITPGSDGKLPTLGAQKVLAGEK